MRTGIFILTKPSIKRIALLKNSLYFLFKNYNHAFKHPVHIMSTSEFTISQKEEIVMGIREECRDCMHFDVVTIETPPEIDTTKLNKCINTMPTINWGKVYERNIEYFWLFTFWEKFGDKFDYILKMNDDILVEEPIKEDMFKLIDNRASHILYCHIKKDCPIESFGIRNYLIANFQQHADLINQAMSATRISDTKSLESFKELYKLTFNKDYQDIDLYEPLTCNDSFLLIRSSFMTGPKMKPYLDKIKEIGYLHYFKWNIGMILSLLTLCLYTDKYIHFKFKLSEKVHREAEVDKNDESIIISKVPSKYSESGCYTSYKK